MRSNLEWQRLAGSCPELFSVLHIAIIVDAGCCACGTDVTAVRVDGCRWWWAGCRREICHTSGTSWRLCTCWTRQSTVTQEHLQLYTHYPCQTGVLIITVFHLSQVMTLTRHCASPASSLLISIPCAGEFYRATANTYARSLYRNLSVKRVHPDKMKQSTAKIMILYKRSIHLVTWQQEWLVDFSMNLR